MRPTAVEHLDWARQEAMLEAAAVALRLVATGAITARGTLRPALATDRTAPARRRR